MDTCCDLLAIDMASTRQQASGCGAAASGVVGRRGGSGDDVAIFDDEAAVAQKLAQDAVDIAISRHFARYPITSPGHQMGDQSLDVFQVTHLLDSEDHEVIPLALVPIPEVPVDAAEEVRSQAHVVRLLMVVKGVDARVTLHQFL